MRHLFKATSAIAIALNLVALFLVIPFSAKASSQADMRSQVSQLTRTVGELRARIAKDGSAKAQYIDSKVTFTPGYSIFPFAKSSKSKYGIYYIGISSQFRLLLSYFTELSLVSTNAPKLGPCAFEYMSMVESVYSGNLSSLSEGSEPAVDIPAPERYAPAMSLVCRDLSTLLPIQPSLRAFRDQQVDMAIVFTYLHELGHLVLGHKPVTDAVFTTGLTKSQKMQVFLNSMKMSQEQEFEADRWAVDEMIRLHAHPLEVVSFALNDMFIATSGLNCYYRLGMDHPDPSLRMRRIVDEVERIELLDGGEPLPSDLRQLFSDISTFSGHVQSALKCPADTVDN